MQCLNTVFAIHFFYHFILLLSLFLVCVVFFLTWIRHCTIVFGTVVFIYSFSLMYQTKIGKKKCKFTMRMYCKWLYRKFIYHAIRCDSWHWMLCKNLSKISNATVMPKKKKTTKIKNMQRNVLMVCTLWGVPRIVCYEMNTLKLKLRLCNMHREQYAPYHILKHHADLSIFNGNNNVIKYE